MRLVRQARTKGWCFLNDRSFDFMLGQWLSNARMYNPDLGKLVKYTSQGCTPQSLSL